MRRRRYEVTEMYALIEISNQMLEVAERGPWPDVIDFAFVCTAWDQRFGLTVETYHGAGGEWRLLTSPHHHAA